MDYENAKTKPAIVKNVDPCHTLIESIDDHFYGSTENKKISLKIQSDGMKVPTAKKLI